MCNLNIDFFRKKISLVIAPDPHTGEGRPSPDPIDPLSALRRFSPPALNSDPLVLALSGPRRFLGPDLQFVQLSELNDTRGCFYKIWTRDYPVKRKD